MTGTYSFNLRAYPINYPDLSTIDKLFTINIIDPCKDPSSLLAPDSLMDYIQVYTIGQPAVQFQFDAFTVTASPAACAVSYNYEMGDPEGQPVVSKFNQETRTFTFEYLKDDFKPLKSDSKTDYRDFEIAIIGTIGQIETQTSFTLRVQNPCHVDSGLAKEQMPSWCH